MQEQNELLQRIEKLTAQLHTERVDRLRADLDSVFKTSGIGENMRNLLVDVYTDRVEFGDDGKPVKFSPKSGGDGILMFEADGLLPVVADVRNNYPEIFGADSNNSPEAPKLHDGFDELNASDAEIMKHYGMDLK